jgi:hypothetical protein
MARAYAESCFEGFEVSEQNPWFWFLFLETGFESMTQHMDSLLVEDDQEERRVHSPCSLLAFC